MPLDHTLLYAYAHVQETHANNSGWGNFNEMIHGSHENNYADSVVTRQHGQLQQENLPALVVGDKPHQPLSVNITSLLTIKPVKRI